MDKTRKNDPLFDAPSRSKRAKQTLLIAYYLDMEGPRRVLPPLDGIEQVTGCIVRITASQVVRLLSCQVLDTLHSRNESAFRTAWHICTKVTLTALLQQPKLPSLLRH
jgi:hypothetical protein